MAYTYQRTVTVSPIDDAYSWTKVDNATNQDANWINITNAQQNNQDTDTWNIEVLDNSSSSQRTAVVQVNHSNGVTTDSFTITQVGVAQQSSGTTTADPNQGYSIVTGAGSNIFDSGFTMHGDPDYTGQASISTCPRGFMWGTDSNNLTNEIIDTIGSNNNSDPSTFMGGTNAYSYNLTGLQPETTYYYKAFITLNSQICETAGGGYGNGNPGTKLFGALQTVTTASATLNFTAFNTSVGTGLSNSVAGNEVDETPNTPRIWFEIEATSDLDGYTIDIVSLVKTSPQSTPGEILDFNVSNSSMIPNGSTNLTSLAPFEFGGPSAPSNAKAVLMLAIKADNKTEGNETYQLTISPDYKDANGNVAGQHGLSTTKNFIINDTSIYTATSIGYGLTPFNALGSPTVTNPGALTLSTYTFDNSGGTFGPGHQILINAFEDLDPIMETTNTNTPNTFYWSNNADGSTNDTNTINGSGSNAVIHNLAIDTNSTSGSGTGWLNNHAKITFEDGPASTSTPGNLIQNQN